MAGILMKIITVIGIILGVLVGLLLLCLLFVLFCPVSYRIRAVKTEKEQEIRVKIRWLLGFVRLTAQFPDPGKIIAKVLFFKVFDSSRHNDTKTKKPDEHQKDKEENKAEAAGNTQKTTEELTAEKPPEISEQQTRPQIPKEPPEQKEQKEKTVESLQGHQNLIQKIKLKIKNLQFKVGEICGKIKDVKKETEFYKKLIQDDKTRLLIENVCIRLGKVIRLIRPRKLEADIRFGAKTPDVTGYACGVYGICAAFLGKHFYFTPVFDQECLEAEIYAAGHITVAWLVLQVLRIYFDKNFKLLRKRLKKHSARKKQM